MIKYQNNLLWMTIPQFIGSLRNYGFNFSCMNLSQYKNFIMS